MQFLVDMPLELELSSSQDSSVGSVLEVGNLNPGPGRFFELILMKISSEN